jgi:hypothetical protein
MISLACILKDDSDLETYINDIRAGTYQPRTEKIIDQTLKLISHEWSSPPLAGHLHVVVSLPASEYRFAFFISMMLILFGLLIQLHGMFS